jgi:hypothetical protein
MKYEAPKTSSMGSSKNFAKHAFKDVEPRVPS